MNGWYLYAVIHATDVSIVGSPQGIDGNRTQTLIWEDLAAVAAPVELDGFTSAARAPTDLAEDGWLAQALRAHDRVVRDVFRRASVLPLRFGAVCASADDVRTMLRSRHDQLRPALDRVTGAGEWRVRLLSNDMPTSTSDVDDVDDGPGAAWLRRRQRALRARQDRRAGAAATVRRVVTGYAREARFAGEGAQMVCLVGHREWDGFQSAVRQGALDAGLQADLDGPLPAYHFCELSDG